MVKIGIAVVVGLIGISLAYPAAEESTKSDEKHQVTARQGGFGAILAAIGTALVPAVGAIFSPIFSSLASGLSSALSGALNLSTNRNLSAEAQALLVRIPQDSPLYASLVQGQLITPDAEDGLAAVGPSATPAGKTPYSHPGILVGKVGSFVQSEPAPTEDVEPILTHDADVPERPASSAVKRVPQRKRPEIDYLL